MLENVAPASDILATNKYTSFEHEHHARDVYHHSFMDSCLLLSMRSNRIE